MKATPSTLVALTIVTAGAVSLGCSQRDASGLTEGQAILQELREIRRLLEGNAPSAAGTPVARRAEVSLADGHVLGSDDAPLTLVEFTDYQCPFCSRFSSTTFDELKRVYIDTGQLRLVSRDLPLAMHGNAMLAANAARCADEQDLYWEMRATMFRNINRLDQEALVGYADDLDLELDTFEACLASDKYGDEVRQGAADAHAIGMTGTPSFVLGKTSGDRLEGTVIVGAHPFAAFDTQIKALLAEPDQAPGGPIAP